MLNTRFRNSKRAIRFSFRFSRISGRCQIQRLFENKPYESKMRSSNKKIMREPVENSLAAIKNPNNRRFLKWKPSKPEL